MCIKHSLALVRRRLSDILLVGGYVLYRGGCLLRLIYRACGVVVHGLPRGVRGRWQARRRQQ